MRKGIATVRDILGADPGSRLTYHLGRTLQDASPSLVGTVRRLYDQGLVELVQERDNGMFRYVVECRRHPCHVPPEATFRQHSLSVP